MSSPREWMSRVRASLRGPGHDRDLRRELEFHLAMQAESEMRRGIPPPAQVAIVPRSPEGRAHAGHPLAW